MRYQVVYCKRGYPMTHWAVTELEAKQFADGLRRAGYDVTVWAHTEAGSKKTDI